MFPIYVCGRYYGWLLGSVCLHFRAHQVNYFLANRFNGFEGPQWFRNHPENTLSALFFLILWLTDCIIAPNPSLKLEQLEPIFPVPLPRGPDACRTQACWATLYSWGKLKFSTGRGVFQEPGSHLPFLPAWHIFNKGTAVSTNLLFSICKTGGLFNLTSKAKIYKASNSQHKQQESCSRHMDTSCHLSLKDAFIPCLTLSWQFTIHLLRSNVLEMSWGNQHRATAWGAPAHPEDGAAVDDCD